MPHMTWFSPAGLWLNSVELRKQEDNKAIPLMLTFASGWHGSKNMTSLNPEGNQSG